MKNTSITSPTAALIFAQWEKRGKSEPKRAYLGASIIGHECEMYLWLYFRGAYTENFDGRMFRLFNRGQREEQVFCEDLRSIGCEVRDVDPSTNKQFAVTNFGGHFSGHLDSIIRGLPEAPKTWHVGEFKTHNDASFRKLVKEGVAKAKPMHFAQMQVYMGETGLTRALYVAVNKDDDDLYIERVEFDSHTHKMLLEKAKRVIFSSTAPTKCANRPDDFRCKSCPAHGACWHDENTYIDSSVPLTCRTCCHSTPVIEGNGDKVWTCSLGKTCSANLEPCSEYLILPSFVDAVLVDGSPKAINYQTKSGKLVVTKGVEIVKQLQSLTKDKADGVQLANELPGVTIKTNTLAAKYADRNKYPLHHECKVANIATKLGDMPWIDWSSPINREVVDGVEYYEYPNGVLLVIDKTKNNAKLYLENSPF